MKRKSRHQNRPGFQLKGQHTISTNSGREGRSAKTSISFGLCAALAASFVSGCASKSTFSAATPAEPGKQLSEGNSGAAAVQSGESPTNSAGTISTSAMSAMVAAVSTYGDSTNGTSTNFNSAADTTTNQ